MKFEVSRVRWRFPAWLWKECKTHEYGCSLNHALRTQIVTIFLFSSFACFNNGISEDGETQVECEVGQPILVSHADVYRSEEDDDQLLEALIPIADEKLRMRVENAFNGRICVRDNGVREAVLHLAKHESYIVRAEAIWILRLFDEDGGIEAARAALNDESSRVRMMALATLVFVCDDESSGRIKELKKNEPDEQVRSFAKRVLKNLGKDCVRGDRGITVQ